METNDLKPLEWSKLSPINRAQITSFRVFDPVNGREVQAWDRVGVGHGWELSDCEENGRGGRVLAERWPSLSMGSMAFVLPLQVFGRH